MLRNFTSLTTQQNLLKTDILPYFKGVAVACSGGADSTALFHVICEIAKTEKNFQVAVVHIAYGLRGEESETDFRFVESLARDHCVPFFALNISDEERQSRQGESLQEWARRLRYAEFARLAAEGWAIALGHHLEDQAETALMRLARGTSPATLLGMREWRRPYWRPFLREHKATLRAFLDDAGLPFREDSSNAKADYSRNIVRQRVLSELEALFPGAAERIVACAEAAARQETNEQDTIAAFIRSNAPDAQLSRSFLDEAARRLSDSSAANRLGPELPKSNLRLSRREDGSLALDRRQAGIKSARASQHQRAICGALQPAALLEPGSYASFRRGDEQWVLETSLTKTTPNKPARLESRLVPPKGLSQFGEIPKAERAKWQILEKDGEAVGLYNGIRLLLPIHKGICDT